MGYTLTIGEAEIDRLGDEAVRIGARGERHDAAPAYGDPTDYTNSRWPSYTAWHEFAKEVGIHELFYGTGWSRDERRYLECPEDFHREGPILGSHPGAALLTKADRDFIAAKREAYIAAHPEAVPGYSEEDGPGPTANATLARLNWLHYWVDWAVENCANPVLENS